MTLGGIYVITTIISAFMIIGGLMRIKDWLETSLNSFEIVKTGSLKWAVIIAVITLIPVINFIVGIILLTLIMKISFRGETEEFIRNFERLCRKD